MGFDIFLEGFAQKFDFVFAPFVISFQQPAIILYRKLGVNWKVDCKIVFTGHPDGELNAIIAAFFGGDIFFILLMWHNVRDNIAKLNFTINTTRLDAFHNFFEITDAIGKGFHFTEPLIDLGKLARNLFETFVKAMLNGFLQLFIYGLAHLFEFFGVVILKTLDATINGLLYIL